MGDVIKFPKVHRRDAEANRLKEVSDKLDDIILEYLHSGEVEAHEVAGIIAHRLGTLMRHLNDKSRLWEFCEKVLKKQAAIE